MGENMTLDDISVLAFRNEMPDIGALTGPEWLYWYRMRDVYRQYRDNREEGARQKDIMKRWYDSDSSDWVSAKEVRESMAAFWKRIEPAGSAYAKSPSLETSDKFFEAVYCVPRKVQQEQWEKDSE